LARYESICVGSFKKYYERATQYLPLLCGEGDFFMSEKDRQESDAAISDRAVEAASLCTLLRYDRAIKNRPANEVPAALRDRIRLRISQKVTAMAAAMLVGTSIVGGIVIWLYRLLAEV
jgi:hypothetical protein